MSYVYREALMSDNTEYNHVYDIQLLSREDKNIYIFNILNI